MKLFKSHTGALILTTIIVICSILFGAHRSLTFARTQVEQAFYLGADGSGHSIAADLSSRRSTAANLITVASRYLGQADPSVTALRAAGESPLWSAGPSGQYEANQALTHAINAVFLTLDACPLSEKDAQYVKAFQADLAAKNDTILRDPYNALVDGFNRGVLGVFPANLLKHVVFIDEAEAFRGIEG